MKPGRDGYIPDSSIGVLPVIPADRNKPNSENLPNRASKNNAATAASAASVRAVSAQLVAFYFRAPAKAFFRTRVDYLAYARSVHLAHTKVILRNLKQDVEVGRWQGARRQIWLWLRGTTPGVLTTAVKSEGWGVIPHQILPPLIANVGVGAVLYTSYLQILGRLHPESGMASRRAYPPPSPIHTFTAGFLAGGLQSLLAAPLDALQARFDHRDLAPANGEGRPKSMWNFGAEKLREIGVRGVFAGWALSFTKDSLGSAVFFSTFEYIKAQSYYHFVTWYYGGLAEDIVDLLAMKRPTHQHRENGMNLIRPHYALEPCFLLLGGASASLAQQLFLHPLTHFQVKHWDHLEDLDVAAKKLRAAAGQPQRRRWKMLRAYYRAYQETWAGCVAEATSEGQKVSRWLYRGFWRNAVRQVPSTSAGLIIFELIRRKYGLGAEEVRIRRNGYDILLH